MSKNWIQLHSGRKFTPLTPDPQAVDIDDIAHALAHICRYTGHVSKFYSVAEHSVYVSYVVPQEHALAGLLHDASEAYLADIASPVKRDPIFASYREAEARLQGVILTKFGLAAILPPEVLTADVRMLATEAPQLMAPLHEEWVLPAEPYPQMEITGWSASYARARFLNRFEELTQE